MVNRPLKISDLLAEVKAKIVSGYYLDTRHATHRRVERKITRLEVIYVLITGRHEKFKDRFDELHRSWNYAIRGKTIDAKELRIIVSFEEKSQLLIITAIDLKA